MAHFLVDRGLKQKKRCWISCGEGGVGATVGVDMLGIELFYGNVFDVFWGGGV